MSNLIHIDKEYKAWIESLVVLYRQQQVKAAVKVNEEVIRFYWTLGKDISEKAYDNRYGSHFYENVSQDLRREMDNAKGLSESNIRYAKRFYDLYSACPAILQQPAETSSCNVEVKTGKFDSDNVGQLGTYVVAVNHQLNTEGDNPAIGLLICQEKDTVLAQYALESSSQPLGVSEYELSKISPKEFKSSLPSIEDIENELNNGEKATQATDN